MDLQKLPGYVPGFPDEMGVRELGGLVADGGRQVRHGLLYRGSALEGLSDEERGRIDGLGLRFILDLRSTGEMTGHEDYVPEGAEHAHVSGMYDESGVEIDFSPAGLARLEELMERDGADFLDKLYLSMLSGNPALHLLVERFVAGVVPLYFHCTAGKDRTGVSAAVLLMALGVSDDDIVAEYLLTNEYRSNIINMPMEKRPKGIPDDLREHWAEVNGVQEKTMRGVLGEVGRRWGTRERYFEEEYGLDGAALARVRDFYLA